MATLAEQLYSQSHWVGIDGVQTIWNFTFSGGYIFPEHVKAYYRDASGERVDIVVTEDMLIGEFQLEVNPAVPASAQRFVIYRNTPKDLPLVDFEGGSQVTEANLDRAAKQAIFVAAEVLDGSYVDAPDPSIDLSIYGYKALYPNVSADGQWTVTGTAFTGSTYQSAGDAYWVPGTPWSENPAYVKGPATYVQTGPYTAQAQKIVAGIGTTGTFEVALTSTPTLTSADNGKARSVADGTAVFAPSTLAVGFLCTVASVANSSVTVTFTGAGMGTGIAIALDGDGGTLTSNSIVIPPYSSATLWRASSGLWLVSGNVSEA